MSHANGLCLINVEYIKTCYFEHLLSSVFSYCQTVFIHWQETVSKCSISDNLSIVFILKLKFLSFSLVNTNLRCSLTPFRVILVY